MMSTNNVLYMRNEKDNIANELSANQEDIWDDSALIVAYDRAVNLAKCEVEKRMSGILIDGAHASSSESEIPMYTDTNKSLIANRKPRIKKKTWSIGDPCRAMYSLDQLMYEADIIKISRGGICLVRFVGYNNEEEVYLHDLRQSCGQAARDQQEMEGVNEMAHGAMDTNEDHKFAVPKEFKQKMKSRSSTSPVHKVEHQPPQRHRLQGQNRSSSRQSLGQTRDFQPSLTQHIHSMGAGMPQMMVPPPPPLGLLANHPDDESEALSSMLMSWYMSGFHTGYYQAMKQVNEQQTCPSRQRQYSRNK